MRLKPAKRHSTLANKPAKRHSTLANKPAKRAIEPQPTAKAVGLCMFPVLSPLGAADASLRLADDFLPPLPGLD